MDILKHIHLWTLETTFILAGIVVGIPNNMDVGINSWHGRRLLNSTSEKQAAATEPEKSLWDRIEEFYDDKNNFAMYLVLPIIVLVYGGCCMIYCIAKCRQYVKRKKDKSKNGGHDDDDDDDIVTNNNNEFKSLSDDTVNSERAVVMNHRRPQSKTSVTDVKVGMDRENTTTSLPWQVPEESDDAPVKNHHTSEKQKLVTSNRWEAVDDTETLYLTNNEPLPRKKQPPPRPPQPHRPSSEMMSPPPPYEGHERHSKEEIFMLESTGNRYNDVGPVKAVNRPPYNPNPTVRLISQTTGGDAPKSKNYSMARQAAQLLRLDDPKPRPGQPGYKKPKRLVFVAE